MIAVCIDGSGTDIVFLIDSNFILKEHMNVCEDSANSVINARISVFSEYAIIWGGQQA